MKIPITYLNDEAIHVSLKWYRGASRYNNGATKYGNKYLLRLLIGRSKSTLKDHGLTRI